MCNPTITHTQTNCPFICRFPDSKLEAFKKKAKVSLLECLQSYVQYRRQSYQEYLQMFAAFSFGQAVQAAGRAVCPVCGKKHPHQRRLTSAVLDTFTSRLAQALKPAMFSKGTTFETLLANIDRIGKPISGIGTVATYDAALRISFQFGIPPKDFVYFHGDAVIPGMRGRKPKAITNFKNEFQKCGMTAYEIEDFLCTFHDVLKQHRISVLK